LGPRNKPVPTNKFFNLDIRELLETQLFTSTAYCTYRGTRDPYAKVNQGSPFWATPEATRLDAYTGGRLLFEDAATRRRIITFELGYDGAKTHVWGTNSAGFFTIRYSSMRRNAAQRSARRNVALGSLLAYAHTRLTT
jgi:hypothetical protein